MLEIPRHALIFFLQCICDRFLKINRENTNMATYSLYFAIIQHASVEDVKKVFESMNRKILLYACPFGYDLESLLLYIKKSWSEEISKSFQEIRDFYLKVLPSQTLLVVIEADSIREGITLSYF
jgi:hypothetical protein